MTNFIHRSSALTHFITMTIPMPLSHPIHPSTSSSSSTQNNINSQSSRSGSTTSSNNNNNNTTGPKPILLRPKPKHNISNTTLGLSEGTPGSSASSYSSPNNPIPIADKYRNRARTSSIEIDQHSLSEARRRNSSSDRLANNNINNNTNSTQRTASPGAGPSNRSVRRTETRPHRSSTLTTTTTTLASSESRPLLRSRASTSVRFPPETVNINSPPPSPTYSSASSSSTKPRRRAMSSTPRTGRQTHPYRKVVIIFSILVSLFLLGTVIVLSSVRYYLAIPDGAFLTEEEVRWTGEDLIAPLKEPELHNSTKLKRQEWEELGNEDAVLGAEAIPQVWNDLEVEAKADEAGSEDSQPSESSPDDDTSAATTSWNEGQSDAAWGIDGQGSGSYWMRENWDGVVQDADNWDRLYNITAR